MIGSEATDDKILPFKDFKCRHFLRQPLVFVNFSVLKHF